MKNLNLLDIIGLLSLFIGVLFAVFLMTRKSTNKLSNRIFGTFLLLSAIDNIFVSRAISEGFGNLDKAISLLVFLHLPVFYFYILSVCYSDFKLKWQHLLHAIPYVLINLLLLTNFYNVDANSSIILFHNISEATKNNIIYSSIHLQVLTYLGIIFFILIRTKKLYLENYATNTKTFYSWLFQLVIAITILHVFALIKNLYKFSDYSDVYYWSRVVLQTIELSIFCWYVLKALNTPELFKSIDSKLRLTKDIVNDVEINENAISENDDVSILKNYTTTKEPFLNSSLTIQQLANQMNLNVRDASILINHKIGKHFFDFINEYRIEKAKEILKNPEHQKLTVLEILYQVGFNSKSSFNTAFKKHTGTTPTLFRKQV